MKYIKKFEQNNQIDLNNKLVEACISNEIKNVRLLINQGADVNFINKDEYTPLIYSINNINIMKILIKNGANVNFQDNTNQGHTPLLQASSNKLIFPFIENYDIIKLLIDSGADWNIKGRMVNITFFDYLPIEYKEKIIKDYPDKYKNYLLQQKADKFNI